MIHKSAIVSAQAELAQDAEIGPFTIIGPKVKIHPKVKIGNSCLIEGSTTISSGNTIHTGAVIGSPPQDLKYNGEDTQLFIGENNIIREYTTINIGTIESGITKIGSNNLIMAYSHVAHDCVIGSHCVLANCATLAGHVKIEDRAVIGGLVAIHQFTRVGMMSIIGGCSKVVQDIPPFATCDGHPAKVYGLNLIGLRRSSASLEAVSSLKSAFKYLFFSGLSKSHAIEKVKEMNSQSPEVEYLIAFMQSSSRGVTKPSLNQSSDGAA